MREKERADKEAQLMDSYNSHKRSQSLMDKHKDEQLRPSKKKVDKAGKRVIVGAKPRESSEQEAEWKTNHPWKPWDREKDLTAGRQSVNLDPKQFKEGLASRFGASQGEPRNFLQKLKRDASENEMYIIGNAVVGKSKMGIADGSAKLPQLLLENGTLMKVINIECWTYIAG